MKEKTTMPKHFMEPGYEAVYEVGFIYTDDIEPELRWITVDNVDSKEEAIEYAKKRLTPIEVMEVEERWVRAL